MNYKIVYSPIAARDIDEIGAYLSMYYKNTFKHFLRTLKKSIGNLQYSPYLGAPYRDYRKLIVSDYIVFYRIDENKMTVTIYRVLHGSRDLSANIITEE